jgi:hypothetical protein
VCLGRSVSGATSEDEPRYVLAKFLPGSVVHAGVDAREDSAQTRLIGRRLEPVE